MLYLCVLYIFIFFFLYLMVNKVAYIILHWLSHVFFAKMYRPTTQLMAVTPSNLNQFSKSFHWLIHQ